MFENKINNDISRRSFLYNLSAGVVVLTVSPDSSGGVILGDGKHKYQWVKDWGQLTLGMTLGSTHGGIQVDSKQNVYVSTDSANSILVFDSNGKYIKSVGGEWKAEGEGNGTHEIQIVKEGKNEFIYLVNLARHEFAKLTLNGDVVWVKGYPEQSGIYKDKSQFKPTGIAVAPAGDFYVTDGYGANYIHHYSAKGDYINSWGGKGKDDGKFSTPHKIMIDTRSGSPTVLVTDRANHRLQWFTLEGKHMKTLDGTEGELLRLPSALNQMGTDIVIGDLAGRLTILDKDNKLVTHLGDNPDQKKRATNKIPVAEWNPGHFIAPHAVTWDKKGNLYIAEWSSIGRIVKLKRIK